MVRAGTSCYEQSHLRVNRREMRSAPAGRMVEPTRIRCSDRPARSPSADGVVKRRNRHKPSRGPRGASCRRNHRKGVWPTNGAPFAAPTRDSKRGMREERPAPTPARGIPSARDGWSAAAEAEEATFLLLLAALLLQTVLGAFRVDELLQGNTALVRLREGACIVARLKVVPVLRW